LQRVVGREVDAALTGDELLRRLALVELPAQELTETLAHILYARANSFRWRITAPLRNLLGAYEFHRVRAILRENVQPRVPWVRARGPSLPIHRPAERRRLVIKPIGRRTWIIGGHRSRDPRSARAAARAVRGAGLDDQPGVTTN
jgi:hypothetical protein